MSPTIKELQQQLINETYDGLHPEWAHLSLTDWVKAVQAEAQSKYDAQVTE